MATAKRQEGSMNRICRTAGALKHHVYDPWHRAFLRQASQLNCNPLGIIVGLALMVSTIEIWSHSGNSGMWIFLLAAPAAIALISLTIVKLLQPMVLVSSPRRDQPSTAQKRPVPVPPAPPGHNGIRVLAPEGAEEAERIAERV
jgi:hypothetical protein